MVKNYSTDNGSIFVQPDGPNGAVFWLGCHDMGDIAVPRGDVTQTYCPDPSAHGKWLVSTVVQASPGGRITTTLTIPHGKTADWLEKIARGNCPFAVYVNYWECGRRDQFGNFERGFALEDVIMTARGKQGIATREGPVPGTLTFDISAKATEDYFQLVKTRLTTTETEELNGVTFCNEEQCAGDCGPQMDPCTNGYAASGSAVGPATAKIQKTTNGGVTWAACAADPFGAGYDAGPIVCFPITRNTTRVLTGRSTTVVASPAAIAYSDNGGTTWVSVNVGATNGEFFEVTHSICALDSAHIWAVTDQTNVFMSVDGGLTWVQQAEPTASALWAIKFLDANIGLAVGAANAIILTVDGGEHWTAVTGPASEAAVVAKSCDILSKNRFWVGYADGTLWYTQDGGTTWAQRAIATPVGSTAINAILDINALDDYCIWLCGQAAIAGPAKIGFLERSVNGGATWEVWESTTMGAAGTGWNSVWPCDYNHAFTVGGVEAGTASIYEMAE
jgi:photosystem II stability/assembly factor-like uncharacterized protein